MRRSAAPRPTSSRRGGTFRKILFITIAALALLIAAVAVIRPVRDAFLFSLGNVLVNDGSPCKADAIAVLAGDADGERMLLAAKLAQEGYAPKVLVSGPGLWYGTNESDLAIDYAVKRGFSRDLFISVHAQAHSTVEEARKTILPALRKIGARRLLLVTSEFHTGRAGRIYHREAPDLEICVVGSDTRFWDHGHWWDNREGQKIWLEETAKNVADWFRL